jgi:hypothetical protein
VSAISAAMPDFLPFVFINYSAGAPFFTQKLNFRAFCVLQALVTVRGLQIRVSALISERELREIGLDGWITDPLLEKRSNITTD